MPVCASSSAAQAPATFSACSSILCASWTRFSCGNLREIPARSTPSKSRTLTSLSWFSELRRERLIGRNPEPSALASEPVAPDDVTPLSTGLPPAPAASADGDALVARPLPLFFMAFTARLSEGFPPLGSGVSPNDATFSMLGSGLSMFVTESTFLTEATSTAVPLASCLMISVLRVLGITDRIYSTTLIRNGWTPTGPLWIIARPARMEDCSRGFRSRGEDAGDLPVRESPALLDLTRLNDKCESAAGRVSRGDGPEVA
mmetsp:Transcript_13425/g.58683  ORF Transcript_13425/g.58683 Transcript_13425/m.58683 type:complete len:260 (+) Transcript_13425:2337-3116(+)